MKTNKLFFIVLNVLIVIFMFLLNILMFQNNILKMSSKILNLQKEVYELQGDVFKIKLNQIKVELCFSDTLFAPEKGSIYKNEVVVKIEDIVGSGTHNYFSLRAKKASELMPDLYLVVYDDSHGDGIIFSVHTNLKSAERDLYSDNYMDLKYIWHDMVIVEKKSE